MEKYNQYSNSQLKQRIFLLRKLQQIRIKNKAHQHTPKCIDPTNSKLAELIKQRIKWDKYALNYYKAKHLTIKAKSRMMIPTTSIQPNKSPSPVWKKYIVNSNI